MVRTRSVAVTLVLVAAVSSGCTTGAPAGPTPTQAAGPTVSPSTHTGGDEPPVQSEGPAEGPALLTSLEQRVASAMASVGVEQPGVAEAGFRSASMSGGWRGGTALVNAFEQMAARTPGEVTGTVDLDGVAGDVVSTESFGDLVRFGCDDVAIEVVHLDGDGTAGSGDAAGAEELARLLIPTLGC
jgi:hypothetical protein